MHAELRLGLGIRCGRKRVARLMRLAGICGIGHRHTKNRRHRPAPATHDDLVGRRFVAEAPDRLWCTDITQHPTGDGTVYLAAVEDVCTRQIVGWSMADHMRSELVVDALQMATGRRRPAPGAVVHSDRGAGRYLLGVRPSPPHRRTARLDGPSRLLGRQHDDRVVVLHPAA